MAVGIVVVSHSRRLAEAAVELALQMVHGDPPPMQVAAGTIDDGLGTDATAVMSAIGEVDQGDGVVVFVDIGSALMSAELGIELYGQPDSDVRILPAPFVEGIVAGVIRAVGGATIDEVAAEANQGLKPKLAAVGDAAVADEPSTPESLAGEASAEARLINETGLHARPAALFVAEARKFDAEIKVSNGVIGPVAATSSIGLATLNARKGDTLTLIATGPDAQAAVDRLAEFVNEGFGE